MKFIYERPGFTDPLSRSIYIQCSIIRPSTYGLLHAKLNGKYCDVDDMLDIFHGYIGYSDIVQATDWHVYLSIMIMDG